MVAKDDKFIALKSTRDYLKILRKKNIPFEKAYLFGSYARDTFGPDSDIDVALVAKDWKPDIIEAQFELMKLARTVDSRIEPHPFRRKD
jgi:predicted nucleotidyltransferase